MKADDLLCIYLEGIVQGVGMRFYINDLATKLGLKGYVRNMPDGRVKCVAQGERGVLETFIAALKNAPRGKIASVIVEPCTSTETFSGFIIRS